MTNTQSPTLVASFTVFENVLRVFKTSGSPSSPDLTTTFFEDTTGPDSPQACSLAVQGRTEHSEYSLPMRLSQLWSGFHEQDQAQDINSGSTMPPTRGSDRLGRPYTGTSRSIDDSYADDVDMTSTGRGKRHQTHFSRHSNVNLTSAPTSSHQNASPESRLTRTGSGVHVANTSTDRSARPRSQQDETARLDSSGDENLLEELRIAKDQIKVLHNALHNDHAAAELAQAHLSGELDIARRANTDLSTNLEDCKTKIFGM